MPMHLNLIKKWKQRLRQKQKFDFDLKEKN